MATSTPGSLSLNSSLNLSTVGNTVPVPLQNSKRVRVTINGLTGSGATLAIDGSRDGGVTWATTGMSVTDYDLNTLFTALVDDSDYFLVTHGYTHFQARVVTAGTGAALVLPVSLAPGERPGGGGGGGGPSSIVSDPPVEAALGTPGDASGAPTTIGQLKALVNTFKTAITVTLNGMLPVGTNRIGDVGTPDLLAVERPYQGAVAMVVGTAQTAQRAVRIACTAAGNVSFTYTDGTTDVIPVQVGLSVWAGAITTVNTAGTTATATYANLK